MRPFSFLGVVALAILGDPLSAQDVFPVEKFIVAKEAIVRAGPSESFQPTSRLSAGDKVIVLSRDKAYPAWFAIMPPSDSFCWVNAAFVKAINEKVGVIDAGSEKGVEVLAGSRLDDKIPGVKAARLQLGTIVVFVDRPLKTMEGTWYPIMPQPTEVRYIHQSAIDPEAAKKTPTTERELREEVSRLTEQIKLLEKRLERLEGRTKKSD